LVVGNNTGDIFVYDVNNLSTVIIMKGHKNVIRELKFSPNDKILASTSDD
jgi:WD40 repeat protein